MDLETAERLLRDSDRPRTMPAGVLQALDPMLRELLASIIASMEASQEAAVAEVLKRLTATLNEARQEIAKVQAVVARLDDKERSAVESVDAALETADTKVNELRLELDATLQAIVKEREAHPPVAYTYTVHRGGDMLIDRIEARPDAGEAQSYSFQMKRAASGLITQIRAVPL